MFRQDNKLLLNFNYLIAIADLAVSEEIFIDVTTQCKNCSLDKISCDLLIIDDNTDLSIQSVDEFNQQIQRGDRSIKKMKTCNNSTLYMFK